MRQQRIVAIGFTAICAVLAGCASPIRTEPTLLAGQGQIYRDGIPSAISKKTFIVMASPSNSVREGKDRMRVIVSVVNTSPNPIDVSISNFSVLVDGRLEKIFTFEEIAQEIKTEQAWAAFAVALGGAMQASAAQQQASYKSTYGTYNTNTTGSLNTYGTRNNSFANFNANTVGTYSGWIYDPAAGQAAASSVHAQTTANLSNLQTQGEAALKIAAQTVLQRTTVFPNNSHGGQLVIGKFEVPDTGIIVDILANIEGETHTFRFTQLPARK
ncbi:hypothetical protein [Pseudoduganella violacea]|uniref:Uncharacterized protein n=1 Tax=Pseudoduganella violacea TaxID=1715466 RepID=A0A7W5FWG0_9BURK|nr:hypothetical protein [Pseudoduganella violacea]MBB3121807.1 hypothetical protein [Pseudoduganella violacea]